jgi:hypothetical protein
LRKPDNHLLTSVSWGEVLEQNGKAFLYLVRVPQTSFNANHMVSGGAIINTMILPKL